MPSSGWILFTFFRSGCDAPLMFFFRPGCGNDEIIHYDIPLFIDQGVETMKSCNCDVCFIYFIDQGVKTMKSCGCDVCFIYFIDQGVETMKSCSCDVCFIYLFYRSGCGDNKIMRL